MARIASLGSATADIYLIDRDDFAGAEVAGSSIFSKMVIGDKIDIDKVRYEVGGGGTNAAVTFARHGHESIYLGNLSHDTAGESVLACLDAENVDTSFIEFTRGGTGCSVILLDAKKGDRTLLAYRGASGKYNNLPASDLELIAPDWLYASTCQGDMDTLKNFFKMARKLGARVMFHPGSAELAKLPRFVSLLEYVDILMVDKREASQIVPGVLLTELLSHLANYCRVVIITDGSMGAIATDHQITWRLGVYEQVKVRDATGVGDAFGSGFLASYAAELEKMEQSEVSECSIESAKSAALAPAVRPAEYQAFKSALEFASANATSVISHYGAKPGLLTGQEDLHPMPIQEVTELDFRTRLQNQTHYQGRSKC